VNKKLNELKRAAFFGSFFLLLKKMNIYKKCKKLTTGVDLFLGRTRDEFDKCFKAKCIFKKKNR
jgi:hypothetical protein